MINDKKNGYLVDLFDDETFKKKLKKLMADDDLRKEMGQASKELIQRYSAGSVSERFYEFITE